MDPVVVPAPPRSAYNQNRRVSDLLYNQLRHFQHVVLKRGDLGIDPEIARNIHTEGGAAKYIAAVTRAFEQCSEVETVALWESKWTPAISTPPGAACS